MTDIRYGVFLRPDPQTCWAVAQITHAVRQQFGLRSADAFAPHATLIGNLNPTIPEAELVDLLTQVFDSTRPFPVHNRGVIQTAEGPIRFDINRDEAGNAANGDLANLASALKRVLIPVHQPHSDYLAPNLGDYVFAAHLSLANFELQVDERLRQEVADFITGLPIQVPSSFVARCFTLFQFRADWAGQWWESMTGRHVMSWQTAAAQTPIPITKRKQDE